MESNTATSSSGGKPQAEVETSEHEKAVRLRIGLFGLFLFVVFVVGLFWMFTTPDLTVGLTLSFVSGLSMIFLPCTLPLAFVIVPLTMGKDPKKGLFMALFFTLGLTITLSFYGVFIAAVGRTFGLTSDAEVYAVLLGGIAAFVFGLSEIGLLNFKLPSYSGKFPDFIQRQKDYMKTFLLGLLLGNAGVGCPNPAFYVLLGYIALTADLFNGWFLGFVHGMGRSVPLIFLAILGTLGVNALSGIVKHKEGVEKAMGWALVIIGAYLLTFGLFGHDWFIASGVHSAWEQFVVNIGGERFGETILKHEHKLVDVPNMIKYGNMFFLALLALTFISAFIIKRPSRRTIISLSLIYLAITLIIGYSTAWTFQIATGGNVHIEFHREAAAPHEEHKAVYHEESEVREGLAVNLNITPVPFKTAQLHKLDFFVNEKPENRPVPVESLEIEHEKLMHVIGVRSDMNEFFHLHPTPTSETGHLATDYVFLKPGRYKVWSEIKKDGVVHSFGHPEILIAGDGPREEKKVSFGRNVVTALYQVALKMDEPVVKGREHHLSFDIHTFDGDEVEVEDYLAAKMHLTIIKDDWKRFIHTHPLENKDHHAVSSYRMSVETKPFWEEALAHGVEDLPGKIHEEGEDKTINFRVVFPEAGLYKVFVQFRPRGIDLPKDEALTASFWIEVKEKTKELSASSTWWSLLLVSSILIFLLSWGVKKFIRVDPKKIKAMSA